MLNLPDKTLKFRTDAIILIAGYQKTVSTLYVETFVIYSRTKFHMPSSSCSLNTAVKSNAKEKVHVVTTLLFYITQKYYPNTS
jgi:hypothetical protein